MREFGLFVLFLFFFHEFTTLIHLIILVCLGQELGCCSASLVKILAFLKVLEKRQSPDTGISTVIQYTNL